VYREQPGLSGSRHPRRTWILPCIIRRHTASVNSPELLPMWSRLFSSPVDWEAVLVALLPTLFIAWLIAYFTRRLASSALHAFVGESIALDSPLIRTPLRLLSVTTFVLVAALVLFPALDLTGLHPTVGRTMRDTSAWLLGPGLRILLIAFIAYALCRATSLLVRRFELELKHGASLDSIEHTKRARTLGFVVTKVATALIVGVAIVTILNELGVNVAPLLTGAGIAGVALGLGAQSLVRDVLSGFFLILEDQIRVGDDAVINGVDGLVEQINLRTIVLRDLRGTVHVFANGAITTLANHSKDFSHYVIDLNISYKEDPDRVSEVVREVDSELRHTPEFAPLILEPAQIHGVVGFADWSMQLRIRLKTVPQKQWNVGREFRKRLRRALNRRGIEVPYPALRRPQ
jgi:moderate conductance mechanosensitive channel